MIESARQNVRRTAVGQSALLICYYSQELEIVGEYSEATEKLFKNNGEGPSSDGSRKRKVRLDRFPLKFRSDLRSQRAPSSRGKTRSKKEAIPVSRE